MFKARLSFFLLLFSLLIFSNKAISANENDARKTHLEDIFIWKMSDELKLSAREEKQFTEVSKNLNRKKTELNHQIQQLTQALPENGSDAELRQYKKLLQQYSQLSVEEFDAMKKLLGPKRFVSYLKIKNELTSKMKSILIGEKSSEKKDVPKNLPAPKVIVERGD
jgi:hypothetical protein